MNVSIKNCVLKQNIQENKDLALEFQLFHERSRGIMKEYQTRKL